jgi:hypothetical protein
MDGFQFFTSVPEVAVNSFYANAVIRNDQAIGRLSQLLNNNRPGFFTTVAFELPGTVRSAREKAGGATTIEWPGVPCADDSRTWSASQGAVSWSLTAAEVAAVLDEALPDTELATRHGMADPAGTRRRHDRLASLRAEVRKVRSLADPDPHRKLTVLWEYERALNYERLQSLKQWWGPSPWAATAPAKPGTSGGVQP